ncbi:interleukin-5 receptor subunit alpha [Lissotriton helveticus]
MAWTDHYLIEIQISLIGAPFKSTIPAIFKRPWRKLRLADFHQLLVQHPPDPPTDVSSGYDYFCDWLTQALDSLIPAGWSKTRPGPSSPWYDDSLRLLKTACKRAERAWRRTYDSVLKQSYQAIIKLYHRAICKARASFYASEFKKNPNPTKLIFKVIKDLTSRKQAGMEQCSQSHCEELAAFFVEKVAAIYRSFPSSTSPNSDSCPTHLITRPLSLIPEPSQEEFKSLVLKVKSGSPADPLRPAQFNESAEFCLPPLLDLVRLSFSSGIVPVKWKQATAIPILKKPTLDPTKPEHYRPISLLPWISKLAEAHANKILSCHLQNLGVLDPSQNGFRAGHSTETALLAMINAVMVAVLLLVITFLASLASPNQILPPVDLQIMESALGEVTISWKENLSMELDVHDTVRYAVVLETPSKTMQYETLHKVRKQTFALNEGLSARVSTVLYTNGTFRERSQWAEVRLPPHPGDSDTSVTNLSCVTYVDLAGALCLNCTWLAGKNAPKDTKYFLFYRYKKVTEECWDYGLDVHSKIPTSCHFPKTKINSRRGSELVIFINGSSWHAKIQSFYQLFETDILEKILPPWNVTVFQKIDFIEIQWEHPRSSFPNNCFMYEVKMHDLKTGKEEVTSTERNTVNIFKNVRSRQSVLVRARGTDSCRSNNHWSEWSQPVFTGNLKEDGLFIVVIAFSLTVIFLAFISALVCKRFQVFTQLFPPVPSPEVPLKDVFLFPEIGKLRCSSLESEVISYVEELYSDNLEDIEDHKVALMLK